MMPGAVGVWPSTLAYDLNPMPVDVKPRHHALTIDEAEDASSLDTALSIAGYFRLRPPEARRIAAEVGAAVADWRNIAAAHGLTPAQVDRMASAFEHEDLRKALA